MASNFYEELLTLVRGITNVSSTPSVGADVGGSDPSPAPATGTTTIASWRSRTSSPGSDGATGKRIWLVPAGREWQLMGISATLATSGTAGNRQAEIFCNPGENNVIKFNHRYPAGAVQAASLTYSYNFAMGQALMTAAFNNLLSVPLPPLILAPSSTICLWDKAQIAPSTDTWSEINLVVLERVIA